MQNRSQIIDQAQEYAEFRYGDSVKVEGLVDNENQLGLSLRNSNVRSCVIEIYAPGDTAVIFAGPIRYETLDRGVMPVLWLLDLLMTYTTFELTSLVGRRAIVQEAPLVASQMRRVRDQWPAWLGEVQSRERAAAEFGHPEAYGPPRFRSFQAHLTSG